MPFGILKKYRASPGQVAVNFHDDGVAVAHVSRSDAQSPQLHACGFQACAGEADYADALSQLVAKHDLQGIPCVGVLPPRDCKLLQVEAPDVEPSELHAAVKWRIQELIDFPLDEVVLDLFELPGNNQPGRQAALYVVAARNAVVRRYVDLFHGAGLDLHAIDVTELALRNVAALLPDDEKGTAFLYFMPHTGMVTLTRQSTLYLARNIDTGSRELAALPATGADESGMALESGGPVLDRLVLELQRSMDYYESHFSAPPVSGVLLAPTENHPQSLADFIHQQLGTAARKLDLNEYLETASPLDESTQARCLAAIGAALRPELAA